MSRKASDRQQKICAEGIRNEDKTSSRSALIWSPASSSPGPQNYDHAVLFLDVGMAQSVQKACLQGGERYNCHRGPRQFRVGIANDGNQLAVVDACRPEKPWWSASAKRSRMIAKLTAIQRSWFARISIVASIPKTCTLWGVSLQKPPSEAQRILAMRPARSNLKWSEW
jgi:hypothetical protein